MTACDCVTANMAIIFLGSTFGCQETAVVGMFGVPGCLCAHNGLFPVQRLGCQWLLWYQWVPRRVLGEGAVLGTGTGHWALSTGQSSLVAECRGRPEEALEAPQSLGRMSCAKEALVPAGLCWWLSSSYPGTNQNVKHSTCSQTLKEQLVSFKMVQKCWAIPVIHLS